MISLVSQTELIALGMMVVMPRDGFKKEVLELYTELENKDWIQENFDRLRRYLERSFLVNFDGDGFEISFTADQTNFRFPHLLSFQPKDAWITSEEGTGTVVFNYELFTPDVLDLTVSGVTGTYTIRFVAGIVVGNL